MARLHEIGLLSSFSSPGTFFFWASLQTKTILFAFTFSWNGNSECTDIIEEKKTREFVINVLSMTLLSIAQYFCLRLLHTLGILGPKFKGWLTQDFKLLPLFTRVWRGLPYSWLETHTGDKKNEQKLQEKVQRTRLLSPFPFPFPRTKEDMAVEIMNMPEFFFLSFFLLLWTHVSPLLGGFCPAQRGLEI